MKKIYLSHSSDNYGELYKCIEKIEGFEFILPHKSSVTNSKKAISECAAVVAEVSTPSHGVGIELGWAEAAGVPIIFVFKKGSKLSSSLKFISDNFVEYNDYEELQEKLEGVLSGL